MGPAYRTCVRHSHVLATGPGPLPRAPRLSLQVSPEGRQEGPLRPLHPQGPDTPGLLCSLDPEGQQLLVCSCPWPLLWTLGLQFL